jgi:hypothetical protein
VLKKSRLSKKFKDIRISTVTCWANEHEMKSRFFNFEPKFGWGELIALFALVLSVAGYLTAIGRS